LDEGCEGFIVVADFCEFIEEGRFLLFEDVEGAVHQEALSVASDDGAGFPQQSEEQLVEHHWEGREGDGFGDVYYLNFKITYT
jgi:hypothetical protein